MRLWIVAHRTPKSTTWTVAETCHSADAAHARAGELKEDLARFGYLPAVWLVAPAGSELAIGTVPPERALPTPAPTLSRSVLGSVYLVDLRALPAAGPG